MYSNSILLPNWPKYNLRLPKKGIIALIEFGHGDYLDDSRDVELGVAPAISINMA